jgi:hypothetical protein
MSRLNKICFAALTLSVFAVGCSERAPRSFVQPNVIRKSDMAGTWYYVQTVTDAPATSSFMFIGNSSELMKIKFDVQQDILYARRSYEQIVGTEDRYAQDPATYYGQPVAAWKIQKQFDIIRDYNSTTGEETNKIIESEERAWNEREFIRVDWSDNLLGDVDVVGLGINFLFEDGVSMTSASYWESDPSKPDAFHMERAMDNDAEFQKGEANYFDVTNKWVISPTDMTVSYEENGVTQSITYPRCFFAYQIDDCAPQAVKVRHAFAKISPTHDYEPRNWDGRQMELFGIWDVGLNRLTYNRQYGVTNSGFKRHAARFNLWQKSFNQDGSTIPFNQRNLRTIPYYAESSAKRNIAPQGAAPVYVDDFPTDLFDSGKEVIRQWNESVKVAAADVQGAPSSQDLFVWCHNPVKQVADANGEADPQACAVGLQPTLDSAGKPVLDEQGQPMLVARQGDPRRSTIYWVNQMQTAGPLGYGPPLFDIETGETISGQAYIYGAALDTYAARSRDLVLLLLGLLPQNDFVAGLNVQDFVKQFQAGLPNAPTYSPAQVKRSADAMNFNWARGQAPEAPIKTNNYKDFLTSLTNREERIYAGGLFGHDNSDLSQIRRDKLRGGTLEGMMVTSDIMALSGAGAKDWTTLSAAEKDRVSPLRSHFTQQMVKDRFDKMRAFGYDFADFGDEGLVQRAINLANDTSLNMDAEAIRHKLRKDIFLGVTLHEVGHNMGLRHNFRASFDAMNYFPQYWQLRKAGLADNRRYTGIANGAITGQAYAGADCTAPGKAGKLRPRYIDCPGGATSVTEVTGDIGGANPTHMGGGIREFQYSSIMDYGAEFNSDLMGLGKYDKAAMKFSYADQGYVEVFTDAKTDNTSQLKWAAIETFQNAFGFPSPIGLTSSLEAINYTSYPDLFASGVDGIQMRKDVPFSDVCNPNTDDVNNTNVCPISGFLRVDSEGNPLVPYFFCSDEFVGNLTCQRFDSGADAYEQATDIISRYENFYVLNNFKRDRYTFHTSLAYKDRIASRYMDMLREQMTWYTLLRADFADFFGDDTAFFADENGWGSFTQGVAEGFDLIGRTLMRPQAGTYTLVSANDTTDYPIPYLKQSSDSTTGSGPGATIVGLIDGKYAGTTWDFNNCGYYWYDDCQTRIGYFIDKTIALDVLTQSQAYFTGRDTSTDVRKYAIGYILPFKSQVEEKVGALLAGDYVSFAPRLDAVSSKVNMPSWTRDQVATTTTGVLDPATGFTLSLYAGVYGLSGFPSTFDHSFIDSTKIFVIGNGEASVDDATIVANSTTIPSQTVGAGGAREWFVWQDAETGKQYAAHSTPPVADGLGGTYRGDTGVRMLSQLNAIQANKTQVCTALGATSPQCLAKTLAVTQFRENIDVMRSLHAAFGYGVYKTDAPFIY